MGKDAAGSQAQESRSQPPSRRTERSPLIVASRLSFFCCVDNLVVMRRPPLFNIPNTPVYDENL